jgi:hypothetical protein
MFYIPSKQDFLCWIGRHAETAEKDNHVVVVTYCTNCEKVLSKRRSPSLERLMDALNPWNEHGNQIW